MAANNFATCLAHTLEFEGGFSNHPSDPGGATMKGVIQKVYDAYRDKQGKPKQSVRYISDPELREIYKTGYWDKVQGDLLPAGVDLATFDYGVNSGPARANKARNAIKLSKPSEVAKAICRARLAFVRGLSTFSVFGRGWTRRITTIEARSVKMALEAEGKPPAQVKSELERAGKEAATTSKQQGGGAAGTGIGGWLTWDVTGVIVVIIAAAGVAFLVYHAWTNHQRAKAYAAVANEGK